MQELHTLKVTGQGMVTQIEAHVASLEGIAPEDQDEATLSHCWVEALSTQEVASPIRGGKAHGSLTDAGKARGQTLKVVKQEKKKPMGQSRGARSTTSIY
ncbi:hypothetical protein FD754_015178 [Muntiacus muntjak]|uniref:Uncharacterized protein n=1 Tax=Muntiacus muntjak TaxID=9888 RepID=A0A5N3VM50_MUNMU|nr:hypothetical protein FD754_015178 [Muntiacus muntjak]